MRAVIVRAVAVLALAGTAAGASAATKEIHPGDSFKDAVEALQPGDTLIIHAGNYPETARNSITVKGTAQNPVVIKGADGEAPPHISRPASAAAQNTINVEGATYVTFSRLEVSSNGGDAINLNSSPQFITIDQLEIHDVDVGVNFRSSMNNIIVRKTHIHHTGIDDGSGTGEGMYVGCNDATCVVRDSLFEGNWIHDTRNSTQGDGIEIKLGSHSNVVRDNVIYNTGYPCILVYGTQGQPVNLIEGNVMWQCGDSGIQAAADAIIRNNIIIDNPGSNSFNSQPHQAAVPQNLQFVHNTIVTGDPCVRTSSWSNRPGLVFANNAIYCNGDNFVTQTAGVTIAGNVIAPSTSSFPTSGYKVGQSTALDLLNVAQKNVYPTATSRLIDAGNATYGVSVDFNGTPRSGTPDAGAYEWTQATNPGWAVQPGFKGSSTPAPQNPTVTLSANPTSVAAQGTTTLTWSTTNATSCTASGGWTGSKATSGTEQRGPLSANATFTLTCQSSSGGSASKSVSVTVAAATPAPTVNLSASPTAVALNGFSTLSWTTSNATSCTASGGTSGWAGSKATSGSANLGPFSANATFQLACTGAGGTTTRTATVSILAAPTVDLTANPSSLNSGEKTTLTWTSANATSCSASNGWAGNKSTSGTQQSVALTANTTFRLTCTGSGGTAMDEASVQVTTPAPTPDPPAPTPDPPAPTPDPPAPTPDPPAPTPNPPSQPTPTEPTPPSGNANDGGGGGALDPVLIAMLLLVGLARALWGRGVRVR
jgi:hypothetical protein